MKRRHFLSAGLASSLTLVLDKSAGSVGAGTFIQERVSPKRKFNLHYAPHFGMFKNHAGSDPIDELRFMADQGFTALEDNGMKGKPVELQSKIGKELERLGIFTQKDSKGS